MRKSKRTNDDEKWLKSLGKRISALIKKKGYSSPYDFWIHTVGDSMSRSNLDYILKGQVDVRVTSLKKIAEALDTTPQQLIKVKVKNSTR